jgi:allantoinase
VRLVLAGATVMTPTGPRVLDVVCDEGTVTMLSDPGTVAAGNEVLDLAGMHVLPGVIDPHVHTRDPGLTYKEDFGHATRAAAAGGITTILEMPNVIPPVTDAASLGARAREHQPAAHVDFGLWTLALGRESAAALGDVRSAGAVAAKLFWGYAFDRRTGALVYDAAGLPPEHLIPAADTGEVWNLFRQAAAADLLLGIHCEDQGVLRAAANGPAGDYEALLQARPPEAETSAVGLAIELARATGARIHILHVSSERGAELVRRGKADGVRVTAETCPHYLTLVAADYLRIGPALKIFPPVRRDSDRLALISAVEDGTIDSIGSDHAPHSLEEREAPFAQQPAGAVAVETMVPVLLDLVASGALSLMRLTVALTEGTARLYGLYPAKGTITVGSDADFTVVDLAAEWRIDNARLHSKTRLSPWHGKTGLGRPMMTVVRGNVVMRDSEPVGLPSGRFIRPVSASGGV